MINVKKSYFETKNSIVEKGQAIHKHKYILKFNIAMIYNLEPLIIKSDEGYDFTISNFLNLIEFNRIYFLKNADISIHTTTQITWNYSCKLLGRNS